MQNSLNNQISIFFTSPPVHFAKTMADYRQLFTTVDFWQWWWSLIKAPSTLVLSKIFMGQCKPIAMDSYFIINLWKYVYENIPETQFWPNIIRWKQLDVSKCTSEKYTNQGRTNNSYWKEFLLHETYGSAPKAVCLTYIAIFYWWVTQPVPPTNKTLRIHHFIFYHLISSTRDQNYKFCTFVTGQVFSEWEWTHLHVGLL
jgi:hypothetical protein